MNRSSRRNYYRILQVQPDAPTEVIRASYRALMQKLRHHPDLGGDTWQAANINEAYAVLTDPAKRAEYDRTLTPEQRSGQRSGHSPTQPSGQPTRRSPSQSSGYRPHRQAGAPSSGSAEGLHEPRSNTPSAQRRASDRRSPQPPGPREESKPRARRHEVPHFGSYSKSRRRSGGASCAFCGLAASTGSYQTMAAACSRCRAPMTPVIGGGRKGDNRSAPRKEMLDDAHFVVDWPASRVYDARVVDLSPTGLQFISSRPLEPFERVKIDGKSLSAVAVVSRCVAEPTGAGYRIGARFITLSLERPSGTFFSAEA